MTNAICRALSPKESSRSITSVSIVAAARVCVVHHGGVGTTSHGLLAGVPTLIVPFAFDQSDNAEHARKVGTSRTVYRNKYFAPRKLLLSLTSCSARAGVRAERWKSARELKQENGPARAADLIEQVLTATRNHTEEPAYASGD